METAQDFHLTIHIPALGLDVDIEASPGLTGKTIVDLFREASELNLPESQENGTSHDYYLICEETKLWIHQKHQLSKLKIESGHNLILISEEDIIEKILSSLPKTHSVGQAEHDQPEPLPETDSELEPENELEDTSEIPQEPAVESEPVKDIDWEVEQEMESELPREQETESTQEAEADKKPEEDPVPENAPEQEQLQEAESALEEEDAQESRKIQDEETVKEWEPERLSIPEQKPEQA